MTKWFLGPFASPAARVLVFCLPNAGGGALAFQNWREFLPPTVAIQPVQLPGRDNRIAEPPEFATDDLAAAVLAQIDRPYRVYGHSMGGVLGLELVRTLLELGAPPPERLYVGASHPPQLGCSWLRKWTKLDDDALITEILGFGGIPSVVATHRRSRERLLRVLRADLAWLSQPWSTEPLSASVPITAAAGNRDVLIGPEVMRHWAHFGGHDFQLRTVPGGHLFHIESPAAAAGLLS